MAKFAFIYRGGTRPESPEQGKAHMEKWRAWAGSLGAALIYPGMPCSSAKIVASSGITDGSGAPPVSGISVVEAETMEAATAMARSCPHLDMDGDIVVAEGIDMEM